MTKTKRMTVEERVALSLAIKRQQTALRRFEEASNEYNEACSHLRTLLAKPLETELRVRLVLRGDYGDCLLLTADRESFSIDVIEEV